MLRLSFPAQNALGYTSPGRPQQKTFYGQTMSAAYVGSFVICLPQFPVVSLMPGAACVYVTLHPTAACAGRRPIARAPIP